MWDVRSKKNAREIKLDYPLLTVATDKNNETLYTSGIDNSIYSIDLRSDAIIYALRGHLDSVTSLNLSDDGNYLFSNSMDNSIRMWDVRPFCKGSRLVKKFAGHSHNFEKNLLRLASSKDGKIIAAGSADKLVYLWDVNNGQLVAKLEGHKGSVNQVAFNEFGLLASCSSDANCIVGAI